MHPKGAYVSKMVLTGRMTLTEGAAILGVSRELLWHHIQKHFVPQHSGDVLDRLEGLLRVLYDRLEEVVARGSTRDLVQLTKEIRDTLSLIAKVRGSMPPETQVVVKVDLRKFLLAVLCDECKRKLLEAVERGDVEL